MLAAWFVLFECKDGAYHPLEEDEIMNVSR
jgi:hypothetical protein